MANLSYPGVYVDEVSSGVRPIQGASTSTAAFIGFAEKGEINKAVKIFNFTEYQNLYGEFLNNSFLSHSVYQFFNNGGSQCYIVRVGKAVETAKISLNDRGTTSKKSLEISAKSPGVWGNQLAVKIEDGKIDSTNNFDLLVYRQDPTDPDNSDKFTLIERFDDLSMLPDTTNFVESRTSSSKQIRIQVSRDNTNSEKGTSVSAKTAPSSLLPNKKMFRVNINGDGYQEISIAGDLQSVDNIKLAIQTAVGNLTKQRASTPSAAFTDFVCSVIDGKLVLTSGVAGVGSSVMVAPAINREQDASESLGLGKLNGGVETFGGAVTRPQVNLDKSYYFIGDNVINLQVSAVQAGSDGEQPGDAEYSNGLKALDSIEDVSLIAIPGANSENVIGDGMNYCGNRSLSDCFFIGDMRPDTDEVAEVEAFTAKISPKNSYGAVYVPWIKMVDPLGLSSEPILVPPSGFVAGLYAKTDAQRGVWKAPAGVTVGVGGAVGLAANFTDVEQGNLNDRNINVIRQFASSGIVLWGARTLTADPEWKYIPVRRMAMFLRVSIYRGIQFAVFEPNDEPLWSQLRLNINSFMTGLFRRGAFQGSTPSQAFFVKCDGETTTQDDINLGIVNVMVGFAPLKPAEFVVVRISQKAGQSS